MNARRFCAVFFLCASTAPIVEATKAPPPPSPPSPPSPHSQRCVEGDYVCELVQLHTSGLLTSSKIQNLSTQIQSSYQKSMGVEVSLNHLNARVEGEAQSHVDLRAHLFNHQNHTERQVNELAEQISFNSNFTTSTANNLILMDEKQTNVSNHILLKLQDEMIKVNETLQRDASEQIKEQRRIAELEEKKAIWEIERENIKREEAKEKLFESDKRIVENENRTQRLAKERIDYENNKIRKREEESMKLNEASESRQEAMRRETEEALIRQRAAAELEKANVEIEVAIAKAKAEAEGLTKQERDNEDIKLRLQQSESDASRKKMLDAINLVFVRLADGSRELISEPERLLRVLGAVILLAAGVYFVREFSKIVAREIERRLGKPSLVRDTSRMHGSSMFGVLYECVKRFALFVLYDVPQVLRGSGSGGIGAREEEEEEEEEEAEQKQLHGMKHFEDVILEKECAGRIMELAQASRNAQMNRAPYRHLLFYGPAGTGKSMVAKRLALHSGMDWCVMSGGDVGPLGEQAVTDLHSLFSWARSSSKGLMLFIDEAEAFLGSRSRQAHTVHMRNALNALLFQTGDQSKHFMLVLATNRAADLDAAVLDRIDEAVHFALPGTTERLNIASQYFSEHVLDRSPSLTKNVWYRGGGITSTMRKGVDTLLCNHGTSLFGPGLVPSKQIVLQDFERCNGGSGTSDTEDYTEGSAEEREVEHEEVLTVDDDDDDEEEDNTSSKRIGRGRGKKTTSRRRTKTPVRKSKPSVKKKRRKATTKKQKNKQSKFHGMRGGHYSELREKIGDIDCPVGTAKGIELYMRKTAEATESFSGRQLAKMMISCQGAIYGTEESILTPESYWKLVRRKVEEHQRKRTMAAEHQQAANGGGDNQYNYA